MFDLIKALFAADDGALTLLEEAHGDFVQMLDMAHGLLIRQRPHLLAPTVPEGLEAEVRSIDKATNKLERTIRKLLVEHLAFERSDAPTCLVLMSVSKDGERLVDECRNLTDLAALFDTPVPEDHRRGIDAFAGQVIDLIAATRDAFAANDEAKALEIVEGEKPFIKELKEIYDRIYGADELSVRQGIIIYRGFRALQRIRAHLANIASTIVFPLHRIDFAKKKYIAQAKERLEGEAGEESSDV